ncbi:MAG: 4Fe-4S dicluster domain-containing protein [Desulfobia sp.]
MNDKYILYKEYLVPFLRKLAKDYRLIAPLANRHGDVLLQEVESVDTARFDFDCQAQGSAKPFLLPQQEVLFSYRISPQGEYVFKEHLDETPTVFFGLRSCDLSAILYMDVIFLRGARDIYYLKRRENSLLISIGCNEPSPNCFCNATGSGPFLDYGFDLQLTDLGDRFFVEPGRIRGEELIRRWRYFFQAAAEQDAKAQYQLALEARADFKRQVHVESAFQKLAADQVDERIWSYLSSRCQDCGGCAYICPTCTCFTVYDRSLSANRGERVRSWDACTFSGFTGMAGGHNPVDRGSQAVRRRFLHKLLYDYQKYGRPGCVGCGRCVDICFGGVDIISFIDMVCGQDTMNR